MDDSGALEPEETSFLIAESGGTGLEYMALIPAIEELNSQGWNIKEVELGSNDLMVASVVDGQTAFGTSSIVPSMIAQSQGAPLSQLMLFVKNNWTSYSVDDITSCEELAGRRYAVHSFASITFHFPNYWVSQNCPGTDPEWLLVPGSENRVAAMLADEVDATTMTVADGVNLEAAGAGRFRLLTPFNQSLPDVVTAMYFGNTEFMDANPNTTILLLAAILKQHRLLSTDPAYFEEQFRKNMPDIAEAWTDEVIADVVEIYSGQEFFPADGGLTLEKMENSLDFYKSAELLPGDVTAEDIVDLSYLEAALEALDR